ncbi:hypothetical protein IWQ60_009130 [Tieghemiomyces parasiticus]|uniref:Uncharacterized protein n=1 Tax=Tieghemiomyces parasiticus TaxID=78921 RepID=A0A9W7ZQ93_9FUNG|nr:hypothetical protein IWQ60_009130 [Tieghemiomyces parasiticus]
MAPAIRYTHLISAKGDLVFSFVVGTLAYALYERDHPREDGRTLWSLLKQRVASRAPNRINE